MINETIFGEFTPEMILNSVMTKFALAIIILLCGFILGRFVGRLLNKILQEFELNNILKKATGIQISLEEIIGTGVSYFIYFITIIMALETINLAPFILYILSSGVIIIIIISIILSVKDFFPNVVSSIIIHQKGYIKEGDHVKIDDVEGIVNKINLLETTIVTKNNDSIFVPNSRITRSKIIKFHK